MNNEHSDVRGMEILVGGFGALHGEHSPGVERIVWRSSDSGASAHVLARGVLSSVPSPTWLERDGGRLYAALEDTNEVAVWGIEASGDSPRLHLLSRVPSAGTAPNHVALATDPEGGRHLIVANYSDGIVGVHPLASDGSVLEATQALEGEGRGPRPAQEGPHAHWTLPLPDGRVLTSDLGADLVYVHRWRRGTLMRVGAVAMAPGTGPRDLHLLPGTGGSWSVAVVGEWSDTVTIVRPQDAAVDGDGLGVAQVVDLGGDALDQAASLAWVPQSALAAGDAGAASMATNDDGSHTTPSSVSGMAYVGLRGSDRIISLRWDGDRLLRGSAVDAEGWAGRGIHSGGSRPRHILPLGNLLVVSNECSDTVALFSLSAVGEPVPAGVMAAGSPTVALPLRR